MTTTMRHAAQIHDLDGILAGRALRPGDPDHDAARGPAARCDATNLVRRTAHIERAQEDTQ